jgi:hypothetical protein
VKKQAGEVIADKLTDLLMLEAQERLGLPTKDGLQIKVNPAKQSVWIGWRKSF